MLGCALPLRSFLARNNHCLFSLRKSSFASSSSPSDAPKREATPPVKPLVKLDDFLKLDIRVARIISAETLPGSDKLLKLTLDVGFDQPRTVLSGIKKSYKPEQLVGLKTLYLANLEPRKMGQWGASEGMILAASESRNSQAFLTKIDDGAKEGWIIS
jgi:methionyl-tRNA synthetase